MALQLLRRLTSQRLARRTLEERAHDEGISMASDLLDRKAAGVAFAVESALGYLATPATSLSQAVVSRYYGLLHLTIAEQVASPRTTEDLAAVQQETRHGHGLKAFFVDDAGEFPHNFGVAFTSRGFFREYARKRGHQVPILNARIETSMPSDHAERNKVESLGDLLRTVPELREVVHDHLGMAERAFSISYFGPHTDEEGRHEVLLSLNPTEHVSLEYLQTLDLAPLHGIEPMAHGQFEARDHFRARVAAGDFTWTETIGCYHSEVSGLTFVAPTPSLKLKEPHVINILVLYALSIIVRYMPHQWFEITRGKHDEIASLITHYISILDLVISRNALEAITGQRIVISAPGTMNAPG